MIDCLNCKIKKVCSITQEVDNINRRTNGDIIVNISKCNMYELDNSSINHLTVANNQVQRKKYTSEELSNLIKKLNNNNNGTSISPNEHKRCDGCGQNNRYLNICCICGKQFCDDCTIETLNHKTYCQDCYSKEQPSKI